jgi:HJR/Mrr/RecB family endonuclease
MIDYSEIKDWRKFEDLVCDLLVEEGFRIVERSGRGADEGRDIIAMQRFEGPLEKL